MNPNYDAPVSRLVDALQAPNNNVFIKDQPTPKLVDVVVQNAQILHSSKLVPGLMRSFSPRGASYPLVPSGINTLSTQWGLETDFDLIRLVYNSPTVGGYVIVKGVIAPSAAIGDTHSPVTAAGSQDFTMFSPVYFNNAGLDVSPQDQTVYGSGTTTFTVPAGSVTTPPLYFSDWMRVSSLPRTDGGTTALLLTRHLTDAAGTYATMNVNPTTWSPLAQGRVMNSVYKPGVDNVTTPALITSPSTAPDVTPIAIQYMSRGLGYSVLGVGDSLTQGFGSSSLLHGWGYLACLALSTPARPVSFWNQGWQGQVSSNFWANGYNAFKACKPDVVTIATWSPNDGLTQATADAGWSRAMDLANYVIKNGAVPVLMGPLPWSGITTAPQEAARLSVRTRMLTAASNGMLVLDWESVMGTGASPNRIQPALIAADNQHPNDVGNSLMDTVVFRPLLQNILRK